MTTRMWGISILATGQARGATLAVLALPLILTGCGGGGGGDQPSTPREPVMCFQTTIQNCGPGPWDPFGIALSLAWISGQCTREVLCTSSPVETNFEEGIVTDDFIAENWTTSSAIESEPNDSPSESTPFVIQASSGLLITGTVNDTSDSADFLALSFGQNASQNGYTAYLCRTPDDCLQPWYSGSAIYVDLLDQNELIIQTTNMTQTHYFSFQGTAGILYYIAVRASDTQGADFDYKLVITD